VASIRAGSGLRFPEVCAVFVFTYGSSGKSADISAGKSHCLETTPAGVVAGKKTGTSTQAKSEFSKLLFAERIPLPGEARE
jgi:hypothetical protein